LREQESKALQKFLLQLTGKNLEIDTENLVITTQESTEQGRPDLAISQKLDFLFYIEVKDRSGLGWQQLERYYKELKKREETNKQLFLLTRSKMTAHHVSLSREKFTHILWHQVAAWLATLPLQKDVPKYLVKSYVTFLEESQMSLVQIKNYADGVFNMRRMVELIRFALDEAIPNEHFAYTNPLEKQWIGYYWQPDHNWLGFYFDKPVILWIEKGGDEEPRPKRSLNLEETHFFDLDSGEQLDALISFIRKSVEELHITQSPVV
jgi:hypothetical protein